MYLLFGVVTKVQKSAWQISRVYDEILILGFSFESFSSIWSQMSA